eukprot:scaffold44472_cov54-Attheya_sp.AAC.4
MQGSSNDLNELCVISESLGRLMTISIANRMFHGANLASNQCNTTHSLPQTIPLNGTMSLTIVTKAKKLFENMHLQRMKRHVSTVIMADLASTRQLLVRMCFTNAAAAVITDEQGVDELSEIKILTDDEIASLCKVVRRPGGAVPNPNAHVAGQPATYTARGESVSMIAKIGQLLSGPSGED